MPSENAVVYEIRGRSRTNVAHVVDLPSDGLKDGLNPVVLVGARIAADGKDQRPLASAVDVAEERGAEEVDAVGRNSPRDPS